MMKTNVLFLSVVFFLVFASFASAAIMVSPSNPSATDNVVCSYTGSTKPAYTYRFEWYDLTANTKIYQTNAGQGSIGNAYDTLPSSYLKAGNNYRCTVVGAGSADFTAQGQPSGSASYVRIMPDNPDRSIAQFTCSLINAKAAPHTYRFLWYKNDVQIGSEKAGIADINSNPSSTLTNTETSFDVLSEIKCEVVGTATGSIRIRNNAPVFAGPNMADVTFPEDTTFTVNLSGLFTDADNDPLTYTYSTDNTNMIVTFNGDIATFSNVLHTYGVANITINATDSYDQTPANTILVNVTSAPILNESKVLPVVMVLEDSYNDTINLSDYFYYQNTDTALQFYGVSNHPNVTVAVDAATGILNVSASPNWFGNASINVTGSAGMPNYNRTAQMDVSVANVPDSTDLLVNFPDIMILEGGYNDSLNMNSYFHDNDTIYNNSILSFAYNRNDTHLNISIDQITGAVNLTAADGVWNGDINVSFNATDMVYGGITISNSFIVTISPVNDNVIFINGPVPTITFNEDSYNDLLNITKYFWDEENGNALTYNITLIPAIGGITPNFVVSGTDIFINFTAAGNWSGSTEAVLNASDGVTYNESNIFNVTVNPVNDAPYTNAFPAQIIFNEDGYNDTMNMTDYLYDIDDTVLSSWYIFNLQNINAANTSVSMTNADKNSVVKITGAYPDLMLNVTPLPNWAGTFEINFTLTDDGTPALSNTNVLLVNVTPVNDAPVISYVNYTDSNLGTVDITSQSTVSTQETNTPMNVTAVATDADNDQLWYEWLWDGVSRVISPVAQSIKAVFDLIFLGFRGDASAGAHNLTMRVNDSIGMQLEQNWTVNVANVNHNPDYLGGFTGTIYLNATVYNDTINASQYFNETLDGIVGDFTANSIEVDTYTYTTQLISGNAASLVVDMNSTTGALNLTVDQLVNKNALIELRLIANDANGGSNISAPLTINITEVNMPPVNSTIPSITVKKNGYNDSLVLSDYFSDSNTWDATLAYSAVTNDTVNVPASVTGAVLNITAKNGFIGNVTLNITATDAELASTLVPGIIVQVVDPITFNGMPASVDMNENGANSSIDLNGYVNDFFGRTKSYTYSVSDYNRLNVTSAVSDLITVTGATGLLNVVPTPHWSGNATLNITVTAGDDSASTTMPINVFQTMDAPIEMSNSTFTAQQLVIPAGTSQTVNFNDYFIDWDGFSLQYNVTPVDSNVTIANMTGDWSIVNMSTDPTFNGCQAVALNITETAGGPLYKETSFTLCGNDTIAPSILSRNDHTITANTAYVNFTVSEPANYTINWRAGAVAGTPVSDASFVNGANVQLTGLTPNSLINYTITLYDNSTNNNNATYGPYTFNTLASNIANVTGQINGTLGPLYGAVVQLVRDGAVLGTDMTDENGTYLISAGYGDYNITVTKSGFGQNSSQLPFLNPMNVTGYNTVLTPTMGGAVSGSVWDMTFTVGIPAAGRVVELYDYTISNTVPVQTTKINGANAYKFVGVPVSENYHVTARMNGYTGIIVPGAFGVADTEVFNKDIVLVP